MSFHTKYSEPTTYPGNKLDLAVKALIAAFKHDSRKSNLEAACGSLRHTPGEQHLPKLALPCPVM